MPTVTTGDNNYGVAKLIVDPTAGNGNYTTIGSALSAASSGQTIFIRPGTYTENPTLVAGVNLTAFQCDALTPNVIINGNCTFSGSGTVSLSGIQLQTNSGNCITVSGSSASVLNLFGCYINASNNTAMLLSSSSSSAAINLYQCNGNLGTTGISYFSNTGAGSINFYDGIYTNTAASTTASTASNNASPAFTMNNTNFQSILSLTGNFTGCALNNSIINYNAISILSGGGSGNPAGAVVNGTAFTQNTAFGNSAIYGGILSGGSSSAVNVANGSLVLTNSMILSINTYAIVGASGTLNYSNLQYGGSGSNTINIAHPMGGPILGAQGTGPGSGGIGERMVLSINSASAIASLTTAVTNVGQLNLTPGCWDITGIVNFTGLTTTTVQQASVNTTSATLGTAGDNLVSSTFSSTTASDVSLTIPAWRLLITSNQSVYLVGSATYTVGTGKIYGRISAVRSG